MKVWHVDQIAEEIETLINLDTDRRMEGMTAAPLDVNEVLVMTENQTFIVRVEEAT